MGRLASETTTSGGTVAYSYNALNLKKQLKNARGQIRNFTYDALGRIIGYTDTDDSVSYSYDENGNVLTATDKNGTITREYDELNRVTKYTDTYGNTIQYRYDAIGNLTRLIYPDGTAVVYTYDVNNNLVSVTDWENRTTKYSYDANNKPVLVIKPDGSRTKTVYDNAQRVVSAIQRTASGIIIEGFEYIYDELGRIICEKTLANNTNIWYNYDKMSRVTEKTVYDECGCTVDKVVYKYDDAGNLICDTSVCDNECSCTEYDTNNRLACYDHMAVNYDADGNMTEATVDSNYMAMKYDSSNRLVKAGNIEYTYNAENVRIRSFCSENDSQFVYDTVAKLSRLLIKNTNGEITKYVYGRGLIGEECGGEFRTYHFDHRGSTIAITDIVGNITDTFKYDTYGKLIGRSGTTATPFLYNGRDGVMTEDNGLFYMRARYYSPDLRRFINADVVPGKISNAITLNRYAYANGNPVSNIDPLGLTTERSSDISDYNWGENRGKLDYNSWLYDTLFEVFEYDIDGKNEAQNEDGKSDSSNWTKKFIEWIIKNGAIPAIENIEELLSNVNCTYSLGTNFSGSTGIFNFNFQNGISLDAQGNISIQIGSSAGVTTTGTLGGSLTFYKNYTNAPSISHLEGTGYQIGASYGVLVYGVPIVAGGDLNIIPDTASNKTYYGISTNAGIGSPGPDVHIDVGVTNTLVQFNVFDVAKNILNTILES